MSSSVLEPVSVLLVSPSDQTSGDDTPRDPDGVLDVEVAASAADARERLSERDVDCVLCDHAPPAVDAVEFVASVRDGEPDVPVLVFGRHGDREVARRAVEAGATDVFESSVDDVEPAVLCNRIEQFARPKTGDPEVESDEPATATSDPPASGSDDACEAAASRFDVRGDLVSALAEATRSIRDAKHADDVAAATVEAVGNVLDAPGAGVFRFDDERNYLRATAITDEMVQYYGGQTVFGPGKADSITWRAFVDGETRVCDDVRTEEARVNPKTDARASAFIPLGEHGVLAVATEERGVFAGAPREVVALIATTAESALDRIDRAERAAHLERQRREEERRVGRVERASALRGSIEAVVVEETTREDVEAALLDRLVEDERIEMAWIGALDPDAGVLNPRQWTGGASRYLEAVDLSVADAAEPACRTARDRTVTAVPNVAEALEDGDWKRTALSRGYHSVLSVPIEYDGVRYGTITVYADCPHGFANPLTSVLERVGALAGYAINATERSNVTLSTAVAELELQVDESDDVLNDIASRVGGTVECHEFTPLADGATQVLFSVPELPAEPVLAKTTSLVAVDSVEHVEGGDRHMFRAVVTPETIGSVAIAAGAAPVTVTAEADSLLVTVHVPTTVDVRTYVTRLRRRYPGTTLLARRERDRSAMARAGFVDELESVLTDRQLEVLRTAYHSGFFKSPREATGQAVADELGVSQPTVSHHLRAGQGKLFSLLFGDE